MFFGSVLIISRLDSQSKFKMFTLFSAASWRTREVLQHGGSILGPIILHGTFRRIAHLWDNAHILKLENCLLCLSSIILQFFNFIHRMVFDFIFYYVTMNTLYKRLQTLISQQLCTQSLYSIHIQ